MEEVCINEITKVEAGKTAPKEFSDDGLPFIRAGHLEELLKSESILHSIPKVNDTIAKKYKLKKTPANSILFAKSGMSAKMNRIYITEKETYFVNHLASILPSNKFNTRYLALYLKWFKTSNLIIDTSYPSIRLKDIRNLKIPLPDLSTQKSIAARLDRAEAVKTHNQNLLAKYNELAQSIFLEMFGDPKFNPKEFELSRLGDEFDISSGGTPSKKNNEYWENGNVSWIGSNMCQNKIIFENDGKYITEKGLNNSSAKIFPIDTVLVALVGATVGKVALNKFKTTTNQNIAGIQPSENHEPIFVMHFLINSYYKFLELGNKGFRMANLTFLRNFKIYKAEKHLQTEFARRIENIERQKELLRQEIDKSEALFQSLLQESFTFPSSEKRGG